MKHRAHMVCFKELYSYCPCSQLDEHLRSRLLVWEQVRFVHTDTSIDTSWHFCHWNTMRSAIEWGRSAPPHYKPIKELITLSSSARLKSSLRLTLSSSARLDILDGLRHLSFSYPVQDWIFWMVFVTCHYLIHCQTDYVGWSSSFVILSSSSWYWYRY